MRAVYISPDTGDLSVAEQLGLGFIFDPSQHSAYALIQGNGQSITLPAPVTLTQVQSAEAPIISAEATAEAAQATLAANQQTITANLIAAQTTIQNWITANPSGAVLTAAQTLVVAKMLNGLTKLLLAQFSSTSGT